jgi:hypothetical protein
MCAFTSTTSWQHRDQDTQDTELQEIIGSPKSTGNNQSKQDVCEMLARDDRTNAPGSSICRQCSVLD